MSLAVGIVGLPNVGKSTTFNALTKASNAQAANYPFCTIEPNKAVVEVPDARLDELAKIVQPKRIMRSQVEFVDIAGLVKGASKGEGLGNKFLANIRECEVLLHIVRCFDDSNITHVEGHTDPVRDAEIIETELILADIEQLSKKIEKLTREAKSGANKEAKAQLECANKLLEHLNNGKNAASFDGGEVFESLNKELRLLSAKEMIYGANTDESGLADDNDFVKAIKAHAKANNREVIKLCAKIEEDLVGMDGGEAKELLAEMGADESGLELIIKAAFAKLGLISYFTAGVQEVRSWTIKRGWLAPKAASVIHNDFEKGFIKAEVISYDDFVAHKGEAGAKEAGKLRIEGKEYEVKDGDVMHFRFNV